AHSFLPSFLPSFLTYLLTYLLLTILIAGMMFACKKDSGLPTASTSSITSLTKNSEDLIDVVDGVLTFVDMTTFDYYFKIILESSDSQRGQFESEMGFTSYASITDSLSNLADAAQNESEMLQVISNNNQYLKIVDSTIVTQLPYDGYLYVANANGIFKIDSTYFKATNSGIIAWRGASINEIESLVVDEDFEEELDEGIFYYLKTSDLTESGYGNYQRVEAYNSQNNRRIIFELSVNIVSPNSQPCSANGTWIAYKDYRFTISLRGQIKKFGFWNAYLTNLEFKDVYCVLTVPRQANYINQTCTSVMQYELGGVSNKSEYAGSSKGRIHIFYGNQHGMGDMMHNQSIQEPNFIKIKGKANSSGIGDVWGIINCGY
ncbi:MAG: hypothetical protein Q8T08_07790, partial [Ignavibacteria bacterium]|nr:hypothetical protein [Ignavibacteria bacterium]